MKQQTNQQTHFMCSVKEQAPVEHHLLHWQTISLILLFSCTDGSWTTKPRCSSYRWRHTATCPGVNCAWNFTRTNLSGQTRTCPGGARHQLVLQVWRVNFSGNISSVIAVISPWATITLQKYEQIQPSIAVEWFYLPFCIVIYNWRLKSYLSITISGLFAYVLFFLRNYS